MDDGINAIILIISVILISLLFFVFIFEALLIVFFIILIVLLPLLAYTCILVVSTHLDKRKITKEWQEVEKIKKIQPPALETISKEQKKEEP